VGREFIILWAGRHRRGVWDDLCSKYRRRIQRFVPIRELPVKVRGSGDGDERRGAEGRALLRALPEPCWAIALDREGEMLSSEGWAENLSGLKGEWPHPVAFVLGSDLGLDPEVRQQARQVLSFGPLTLSHELARLVLYEQLYRTLCIEAGINYHRQRF
jgi:23S rRNA (pseudouridine1915-N3)-methyltransferase